MYTARTQEEILSEMLAESTLPSSKIEGTFEYDVLASNAVEFNKVEVELAEMHRSAFGMTAWDEYLDMKAEGHGVIRREAVKAIGSVTVTGNGIVEQGSYFQTAAGTRFTALETVIVDGSAEIQIEAVDAGESGNVAKGAINIIPINIPGIQSVTNLEATHDGYDREDDETYRARYLKHVRLPAVSGNPYQYEEWDSGVCDNTGVYGGNGVVFAAYTYITLNDENYSYWEKYAIKDDYDYFSCKFAISGKKESYINTELSIVLNVYCDDVLVYTSDSITGGSLPVYIENVNVSGASTITLEIVASNNTGDKVVNDRFAVGWVDPKLSKKYVPLDSNNDTNISEDNINVTEENLQNSNSTIEQTNTNTRKTPFYGIWCYGSKNEEEAINYSKKMVENGIDSVVFVTTDWSNLNSEKYYVVAAGIYESEDMANDNLNSIKSAGYSDAYVKYSGEYIGK